MLRINSHTMDLDLSVMGYIRNGHVACKDHAASLTDGTEKPDTLYGRQAVGQVCDTCGTPLDQHQHTHVVAA